LRAVARPPFRPAAFFWAVVPPWRESLRRVPDPDAFPPRLDAPGELAIRAARSFDIPFSLSFSYCFSFFTFGRLFGTGVLPGRFDTSATLDDGSGIRENAPVSIRGRP
jgi:hypothetical protein